MTQLATAPNGQSYVGTCDHCSKQITNAEVGFAITVYDEDCGTEPIGFVCKACEATAYAPLAAFDVEPDGEEW